MFRKKLVELRLDVDLELGTPKLPRRPRRATARGKRGRADSQTCVRDKRAWGPRRPASQEAEAPSSSQHPHCLSLTTRRSAGSLRLTEDSPRKITNIQAERRQSSEVSRVVVPRASRARKCHRSRPQVE